MSINVLQAPALTPSQSFQCPSGNAYISTAQGLLINVANGDVDFLLGIGARICTPRNNFSGSRAPTAADDASLLFDTGSVWVWTGAPTHPSIYLCVTGFPLGAASWVLFASEAGLGTIAVENAPLRPGAGGTGLTSYGALDGEYLAKTAAYVVVNADKRKTISCSGNALYAITVNAPGGYDSDFQCKIYNADPGRAKNIIINGIAQFFLWPLQSVTVSSLNATAWMTDPTYQRWYPLTSPTFYVDPGGNDASDGLNVSAPRQTVLNTWNLIRDNLDGPDAIIQLTPGANFGPLGELTGDVKCAFGTLITITGDDTLVNPPIVTTSTIGTPCVEFRDGGWTQISGIQFNATVTANGIVCTQLGLADIRHVKFVNFGAGSAMAGSDGGIVNADVDINVFGNMGSLMNLTGNMTKGLVGTTTIDFHNNGSAFSNAIFTVSAGVDLTFGAGLVFANTVGLSGSQYALSRHALLESNGASIPGSAGSVDATSNFY